MRYVSTPDTSFVCPSPVSAPGGGFLHFVVIDYIICDNAVHDC